jgi:chromosome segregation ATPase
MNTRSGIVLAAITVVMLGAVGCGRKEAEQAKKELEAAKADLAKLQDEVKSTQQSFGELEKQYTSTNQELQAAKKAALAAKSKLQAVERQLAAADEDAKGKLAAAQKQINDLKQQIKQWQKKYSICLTEQKSATALAAKLRRENTRMKSDLEKQREEIRQLRGIKPSPTDKPADPDDENLPKIPASAPVEEVPDPTNPPE